MKQDAVCSALAALAQESRLGIFRLLVARGPAGMNPGDMIERLGIPAPTLSFHLKELLRAGLILSRRESRFLYYSADFAQMRAVIAFLTDRCCALADEACDADCKPIAAPRRRA